MFSRLGHPLTLAIKGRASLGFNLGGNKPKIRDPWARPHLSCIPVSPGCRHHADGNPSRFPKSCSRTRFQCGTTDHHPPDLRGPKPRRESGISAPERRRTHVPTQIPARKRIPRSLQIPATSAVHVHDARALYLLRSRGVHEPDVQRDALRRALATSSRVAHTRRAQLQGIVNLRGMRPHVVHDDGHLLLDRTARSRAKWREGAGRYARSIPHHVDVERRASNLTGVSLDPGVG